MPLTQKEQDALNKAKAQKTTKGKGFNTERPQPEKCDRTSGQTAVSAFRVESANHLALATRRNNEELQSLLSNAIAAQQQTAKTTARVVDALTSGEFLHQQIQAELAQLQQPKAPVDVEFETFDPIALLGSGGRDVVKALPGA